MKRCVKVHTNGRRCWAVAPTPSQYCDIHAPASEEHSMAKALEPVVERYNAAGSFIENYWMGDRLYADDFLEAAELAMGLAEALGAGREVQ